MKAGFCIMKESKTITSKMNKFILYGLLIIIFIFLLVKLLTNSIQNENETSAIDFKIVHDTQHVTSVSPYEAKLLAKYFKNFSIDDKGAFIANTFKDIHQDSIMIHEYGSRIYFKIDERYKYMGYVIDSVLQYDFKTGEQLRLN